VINVTIFPEYILPALQGFPSDKEVLVRSAYAECIAQFAQTALRFLELAQVCSGDYLERKINDARQPVLKFLLLFSLDSY